MTATPEPQALPMVVTRTGGFAGFNDVVEIASDGTARLTPRGQPPRPCTPDPAAVRALRAMDLVAVNRAPAGPPVADGFSYGVTMGRATAMAGDGDQGARAKLARLVSAIVSSCVDSARSARR